MYAYVQWDVLVRYLRYLGNNVKWVMNLTDVGHMTSDEDAGEDKMEKGAKREGLTVWQIADKYIEQFTDSLESLNIQKPDVLCRATDNIAEQIDLIKKIEANGFTYKTKTGLVFDTSKFPDYVKFANLNLEEQNAGARTEVDLEKKNPWDFLLWVTNQPSHIMQWDSPWGRGFPGWHIECTAMSTKYLGETFDIHTGGKEHISVHHTNEIAQGFGAFGHQTANYWLHNEWLIINGEKMSKSLGNNVLVSDLMDKSYDPLSLRYLILTSHYKTGLNFTWESLNASQAALEKLRNLCQSFGKERERTVLSEEKNIKVEEYRDKFLESLNDDLNFPQALAVLWEMVKSNIPSGDKYDLAMSFDEVLGLDLDSLPDYGLLITDDVKELLDQREAFRKSGNFKKSDEIRIKIEEKGLKVLDTLEGPIVKPLK
jgi:cysteinyl-tRNA synthetase